MKTYNISAKIPKSPMHPDSADRMHALSHMTPPATFADEESADEANLEGRFVDRMAIKKGNGTDNNG